MSKNLPEKLRQAAGTMERKQLEELLEQGSMTFYAFLKSINGERLDDLIEQLMKWKYEPNRFLAQLGLHKQILLYFTEWGIKGVEPEGLDMFQGYYDRMILESQVDYSLDMKRTYEEQVEAVRVRARALSASHCFEPDKKQRVEKAKRFVYAYVAKAGGVDKLEVSSVADASLKGFSEEEMVNGRHVLLILLVGELSKRIEEAGEQSKELEKEFRKRGGRLDADSRNEFDAFVHNLHPRYSPSIYDAKYVNYIVDRMAKDVLPGLRPLPGR